MTPAIVSIQQHGGIDYLELARNTVPVTRDVRSAELNCSPDSHPFATMRAHPGAVGVTQEAGQALLQALLAEGAVEEQIFAAIAHKRPLYIADRSTTAQALPWEALCRDDGFFLALDGELPLARTLTEPGAPDVETQLYDPPLRVLAVLAAAGGPTGDTAVDEWASLSSGLSSHPGLGYEVRVLGCDADVKTEVDAHPSASFEYLASEDALTQAVAAFQPHIVHFFCHGFAEPEPRLELATRSDQARRERNGSISVTERAFDKIVRADPSLWAIALNCCLGATPTDTGQPLARRVLKKGVPAVFAMQEPVERSDAHVFCTELYSSLVAGLEQALAAGPPHRVDLPAMLKTAREKLFEAHMPASGLAADCKEWTLPVIYVHRTPFALEGQAAAGLSPQRVQELRSQIATLRTTRQDMQAAGGIPDNIIEAIGAQIEQLEQELLGA